MSNLYNILSKLCDEAGISGYKMCKDVGLQPSIMTDLKKGRRSGVSAETASKIANYFGVSVDYLLGKTEEKNPAAKDSEITFDDFTYAMYNETKDLSEEDKNKLLEMARIFKKMLDEEKNK